jgi:hypothetical protein
MAHLNLRDRVIETTIVYVGAKGPANLAHLSKETERGRVTSQREMEVEGARVLAVEWRPRNDARLNDCELAVTLLSIADDSASSAAQSVLVDADGMVLMLDADVDALDRNERATATVREALARAGDKKVQVVVQVNDATVGEGEAELDVPVAEDWPRVRACPAKGEGVMETLQRAVSGVVESMKGHTSDAPTAPTVPRATAPRVEGNPLLAALRQMMETATSERIAALEERLTEKIARLAASVLDAGSQSIAVQTNLSRDAARETERLDARVRSEAAAHREAVLAELRAQRTAIREELARIAASMEQIAKETSAGASRVDEIASIVAEGEVHVGRHATEVRAALKVLTEELQKNRKAWP